MLVKISAVIFAIVSCANVAAQTASSTGSGPAWPAKPVRIIVAFAPGGGNDVVARLVAQKLTGAFNRQFVVDNRPGAGGAIGTELAAKSPPDGYTLFLAGVATHAVYPNLQKNVPYDAIKDFDAICLMATAPTLLAVHPTLPARNVKEFIALARAKPGQLDYASSGHGSAAQLSAELFKSMTKINIQHVPYKGIGVGLNDLLSGQVQVIFNAAAALLPHTRSGRLRALGVGSTQRVAAIPDVPTISESGVPGYQSGSWYGFVAPAGTPRAIITSLNRETVAAIKSADITAKLVAEAALPIASTPEEFTAHIKDEFARVAKVIRDARITGE
jgi:tripartite-type tricarboxylate transporter receptor subunit TctC